MWRILHFAQLAEQNRLFERLFHVKTNYSCFVEDISLKAGDEK